MNDVLGVAMVERLEQFGHLQRYKGLCHIFGIGQKDFMKLSTGAKLHDKVYEVNIIVSLIVPDNIRVIKLV
jgi:hypothetical protein